MVRVMGLQPAASFGSTQVGRSKVRYLSIHGKVGRVVMVGELASVLNFHVIAGDAGKQPKAFFFWPGLACVDCGRPACTVGSVGQVVRQEKGSRSMWCVGI